ncbi:hypothetical protein [Cryobacterium sp. AP23]
MSENLLLHRRAAPHQRAVPSPVAPPHPAAPAPAQPAFPARNSPVDLLFRGLWQLVGVYVFVVLVVKDHKLPR